MKLDITDILKNWEYDPEDYVRVLKLKDGREVLQVRQPLGIEQYELIGRPDGKKPFNKDSVLQEFLDQLEYHKIIFSSEENFELNFDDFLLLQEEGMLYYSRYLLLYQIGDFQKTIKDTEHNLKICELVEKYYKDDEVRNELLQYRPYIVKVNAISKAMINVQNQLKSAAQDILKSAIEVIQNIPDIDTPTFKLEKHRSIKSLKSTLMELSYGNGSEIERLSIELSLAIEEEDYESAAKLRDRISELKTDKIEEEHP